mmetsp:Transcript_22513/g.45331  ORF Transcript_22513/g.45331 Transcript_22513/m.45331 type:complete len:207 (-) Transcript_22513:1250-1870(-)
MFHPHPICFLLQRLFSSFFHGYSVGFACRIVRFLINLNEDNKRIDRNNDYTIGSELQQPKDLVQRVPLQTKIFKDPHYLVHHFPFNFGFPLTTLSTIKVKFNSIQALLPFRLQHADPTFIHQGIELSLTCAPTIENWVVFYFHFCSAMLFLVFLEILEHITPCFLSDIPMKSILVQLCNPLISQAACFAPFPQPFQGSLPCKPVAK